MSDVEPQPNQAREQARSDEESPEPEPVVAEEAEVDTSAQDEADAENVPAEAETEPSAAATSDPLTPTKPGMDWYVLRVASNKEEQVRDALERKVKIEALEDRIGRILVPMVKEKTIRRGQARIVQRKLYAGYVFVEMATELDGSIPENVWFLVKETTGVGDFIQSDGRPTSMKDSEVERMLAAVTQPEDEAALSGIQFRPGDRVKIREGPFENFEGDVESIDEQKGMVTVLLTIFGRQSPVDVEYWNVEGI
jgi:transcriptional antiterminator NusG